MIRSFIALQQRRSRLRPARRADVLPPGGRGRRRKSARRSRAGHRTAARAARSRRRRGAPRRFRSTAAPPTSRGRPKKPAAPIRRRSGRRTSSLRHAGLLRDDEDAAHRRPHVHRGRQHARTVGQGRHRRSAGGAGVSQRHPRSAARCSSATCSAARTRRPTTRSRSSASSRISGTRSLTDAGREGDLLRRCLRRLRRAALGGAHERRSRGARAVSRGGHQAKSTHACRSRKCSRCRRYVDKANGPTRFAATLIGIFAGVAVLLAAVGLYGVLATTVGSARRRSACAWSAARSRRASCDSCCSKGLRLSALGMAVGLRDCAEHDRADSIDARVGHADRPAHLRRHHAALRRRRHPLDADPGAAGVARRPGRCDPKQLNAEIDLVIW